MRLLLVSLSLVTGVALGGAATASTGASRTTLLLTVRDLPPDFRVGFKRDVADFDDRALNEVDVSLIFFRSAKSAHAAYKALAAEGRRLFPVHVGEESIGSGLAGPDVNVRWVWWRHRNVVATVVGSYFAGHPNTRSLVDLTREQQRRLASKLR